MKALFLAIALISSYQLAAMEAADGQPKNLSRWLASDNSSFTFDRVSSHQSFELAKSLRDDLRSAQFETDQQPLPKTQSTLIKLLEESKKNERSGTCCEGTVLTLTALAGFAGIAHVALYFLLNI